MESAEQLEQCARVSSVEWVLLSRQQSPPRQKAKNRIKSAALALAPTRPFMFVPHIGVSRHRNG